MKDDGAQYLRMSNDLRRNGQLGIFLSVIAESSAVTEKNEIDQVNIYVEKQLLLFRATIVTRLK